MPINNIVEFIFYILPGFVCMEMYKRFYPAEKQIQFIEIASSAMWGIFIFYLVRFLDFKYFNYFLKSNSNGKPYFRFIIALFVMAIIIGCGRALLRYLRFMISTHCSKLSFLAPDPQSLWYKINQDDHNNWAVVHLNDGAIYLGDIREYTYNPNKDNQEFLLSKAKKVDENLKEQYFVDGLGLYLNTNNINRIEFLKGT